MIHFRITYLQKGKASSSTSVVFEMFQISVYIPCVSACIRACVCVLLRHDNDHSTFRLIRLLESAVAVNMNTIRVWGGGLYESDQFYDLADQLGLLIWQDLMFACNMYPVDSAYIDSVTEEVTHQVSDEHCTNTLGDSSNHNVN